LFFFAEYPVACHGGEGARRTAAKPRAKRGRSRVMCVFGFEEMKLDTLRLAAGRTLVLHFLRSKKIKENI